MVIPSVNEQKVNSIKTVSVNVNDDKLSEFVLWVEVSVDSTSGKTINGGTEMASTIETCSSPSTTTPVVLLTNTACCFGC